MEPAQQIMSDEIDSDEEQFRSPPHNLEAEQALLGALVQPEDGALSVRRKPGLSGRVRFKGELALIARVQVEEEDAGPGRGVEPG